MGIITWSIPFFFLLIGLELLTARVRHRPLFRLNDSISDLSLGILSQMSGIFTKLLQYGVYFLIVKHASVQQLSPAIPAWPGGPPVTFAGGFEVHLANLAGWTVAFVVVDFAYYWLHRLSHEVHILWAGHVVHHSSEEYNLTVALRQSSLHGLFTWVFYLPLAFAGVPVEVFISCHAINLVYQFWIHTRTVGRLPASIEAVWNTPSHHRVHHGVNPKYQDKNYAGVFIVWDKWFGTWVPEEEEPVYGITKPLASWNPVWANVHVFVELWRTFRATKRWSDKWRVVFASPSWRPADVGPSIVAPEVTRATATQYDPEVAPPVLRYAFAQFLAALAASLGVLKVQGTLPIDQLAALAFYVVLTLSNLAVLLEGRDWAVVPEAARHAVLGVVALVLGGLGAIPPLVSVAGAVFCAVSVLWLLSLRRHLGNGADSALTGHERSGRQPARGDRHPERSEGSALRV